MKKKQKKVLVRIIVTVILLAAIIIVEKTGVLSKASEPVRFLVLLGGYLLIYFVIGYDILWKALRGILNGRVFDENFLMAIATLGAFALAVYERSNEYTEAIMVMLLYQVGELFQSYAVGKSRKNISSLMDIRPDYANIERGTELIKVSPDEIAIGTQIVVTPGEKIPIDGVVVQGESTLNTSALTGESKPRKVSPGSEVISGCINNTGLLKIRTTKEFGESTVSKILELVEDSTSHKSKSEDFIHKFAVKYTPIVCILALILAVAPPVVRLCMSWSPDWSDWVYRALTFLVISCPCALVISIPLTFFAGIGGASAKGILIKGSNYLETLSKITTIVFDKTGTLTEGVFKVNAFHDEHGCGGASKIAEHGEHGCEDAGQPDERFGHGCEDNKILEFASLAESASTHPIALSIRKAYGGEININRVANIQELAGMGVSALVDDHRVLVGNEKLMKTNEIAYHECDMPGTIVHVGIDGKYCGHIVISDLIKANSAEAISELKKQGIKRVVMLTGDDESVAKRVADKLGIDEFHANLFPQDKVKYVEEMIGKGKVAFTGDGINDAPVLALADIGIAMGALGSDAAIEAADVVLMDDDPAKISQALKISQKCMRIVYQNIVFALAIKFICLILGALGIANMWIAIFADVGVMILAVLNSIRALRA